MHDLMICREIMKAVNDKLKEMLPEGKKIDINLKLSPLSHVKKEALKETFTTITKGTNLENASLNIEPSEIKVQCKECKEIFLTKEPVLKCPKCDSTDLDIDTMNEYWIDSIEVIEQ
jgi:hydrogenase nickel insertion protein HypA